MSACPHSKLEQLLIIIETRKTKPVQYSVQKPQTLWDGADRVEERSRRFYVTLRHFSGEIIGQHVGLSEPVQQLKNEKGERRTYRLPVATIPNEHLCIYVYNPAVCENGTLPIEISTTDTQCPLPTTTVSVSPDNCQTVLKFDRHSMQKGHVTRLLNTDDGYLVELRIFLGEGACDDTKQ